MKSHDAPSLHDRRVLELVDLLLDEFEEGEEDGVADDGAEDRHAQA